jgi:hypothetical protein
MERIEAIARLKELQGQDIKPLNLPSPLAIV